MKFGIFQLLFFKCSSLEMMILIVENVLCALQPINIDFLLSKDY